MEELTPRISLNALRDNIAEGIRDNAKAYDVPAICVRVGIQERVEDGDIDDANRSKKIYVKSRLIECDQFALLVSIAVLKEFDIPNLAEAVSELTVHSLLQRK